MTDSVPAEAAFDSTADPRVGEILDIFAKETRVDRALLHLDARPDELGVASLDFTLAVFEIESRFGIDIPPLAIDPAAEGFTVGRLVEQVITILDRAEAARGKAVV